MEIDGVDMDGLIPEIFTYPLTLDVFDDPVCDPLRKAIKEWSGKHPLSIDPRHIHITEEVLGEGTFVRVVSGTLNIDGGRVVKVAVKTLSCYEGVIVTC